MNHFQLLASKLPPEKHEEFRALVTAAEDSPGCDIDDGFLGFIEDYVDIARILERHTIRWPEGTGPSFLSPHVWTVIDVGCANGFQHVLFDFAARYIGIDSHFPAGVPKALTPNATFIQGRFADVAATLKFDRARTFAIANMSLAYLGRADDLEAFNSQFIHKFMI